MINGVRNIILHTALSVIYLQKILHMIKIYYFSLDLLIHVQALKTANILFVLPIISYASKQTINTQMIMNKMNFETELL